MPNITNIGAGIYTSLAYSTLPMAVAAGTAGVSIGMADSPHLWVQEFEDRGLTSGSTYVEWNAVGTARAFGRVREFPNLGIPANVVKVPQYGQPTTSQITGQSDAPNMDFTFNYVPKDHAFIDDLRSNGTKSLYRVRLSNAEQFIANGGGDNASGGTDPANTTGIVLPRETKVTTTSEYREFSDFFFFGTVASFEIIPSLTDSNQLKVSLTIDGQLTGPFSYYPAAAVASLPKYGKTEATATQLV